MRPALPLWLLAVAALVTVGCGGGGDRLSTGDLPRSAAMLRVTSPAFVDGSRLPPRYTCDGAGEEPQVDAGTVPASTKELVLVVSDPDAPGGTYVHLTRFGIDPRGNSSLNVADAPEGKNSAGKNGWSPPCPPKGDSAHRYVWSVYALRNPTNLKQGAKPSEVTDAIRTGDILASGTITARYGR